MGRLANGDRAPPQVTRAGAITVALGQCDRFHASVPLARPTPERPMDRDTQTALLVEDDPRTCRMVTGLLEEMGLDVTPYSTGENAISALAANKYDIL